jgi:6-phosphogluconate dehydrogenase (decarboxylating)
MENMNASSLDKELEQLWPLLNITQKESVMQMIKAYLQTSDMVVSGLGVSISQYNKELEEGEAEIDRGESYTHEQVKEQIEQWKKEYKK